jgi:glucuronosyltransferase
MFLNVFIENSEILLKFLKIRPWHFPKLGLPYETSFYPTTFIGASDRMSFYNRLSNWFTFVYMNIAYKLLTETKTKNLLIKRFGDDHINVGELPRKVSMIFVNQHYSLSGAKHLSPNVVELGGIHIAKAQPLDPVSVNREKIFQTTLTNVCNMKLGIATFSRFS